LIVQSGSDAERADFLRERRAKPFLGAGLWSYTESAKQWSWTITVILKKAPTPNVGPGAAARAPTEGSLSETGGGFSRPSQS
jgi:hypothetical protein